MSTETDCRPSRAAGRTIPLPHSEVLVGRDAAEQCPPWLALPGAPRAPTTSALSRGIASQVPAPKEGRGWAEMREGRRGHADEESPGVRALLASRPCLSIERGSFVGAGDAGSGVEVLAAATVPKTPLLANLAVFRRKSISNV